MLSFPMICFNDFGCSYCRPTVTFAGASRARQTGQAARRARDVVAPARPNVTFGQTNGGF